MPAGVHEGQVMTACIKCGSPAYWYWRVCSDGPLEPICAECDLELNRLALVWRYGDTAEAAEKLAVYKANQAPSEIDLEVEQP